MDHVASIASKDTGNTKQVISWTRYLRACTIFGLFYRQCTALHDWESQALKLIFEGMSK